MGKVQAGARGEELEKRTRMRLCTHQGTARLAKVHARLDGQLLLLA